MGESITKSITKSFLKVLTQFVFYLKLQKTSINFQTFPTFPKLITAAVSFSYNQIIIQKRTFFAEMPFDVLCSPKYDSSEKYF